MYRICWSISRSYSTYSCCFNQGCVLYSKYHVLYTIYMYNVYTYSYGNKLFMHYVLGVRLMLGCDLYSSKYGIILL